MACVTLHVYDVANTENENLNGFLKVVNNVAREIRAGGIYHGAIEIYGYEWSFGYCPHGSGVYRVLPKSNQMYTYRESMPLGSTDLTKTELKTKIQELQREWAGSSYDLVARNCNHFCAELCERLGCEPLPGWLNRFANGAEVTMTASNQAYSWMRGCFDSASAAWRTTATRIQSCNPKWPVASSEGFGHVDGRYERFKVPNEGTTSLPGQE